MKTCILAAVVKNSITVQPLLAGVVLISVSAKWRIALGRLIFDYRGLILPLNVILVEPSAGFITGLASYLPYSCSADEFSN